MVRSEQKREVEGTAHPKALRLKHVPHSRGIVEAVLGEWGDETGWFEVS